MKLRRALSAGIFAFCLQPFLLAAEVVTLADGGFTVRHTITVTRTPDDVYAAIKNIGQWWNPDHSWSGESDKLYLDARLGGCFCERLADGGGVEHLRIVYLAPGKEIRFDGALGPLQGMAANGRMLWNIEAAEPGSKVTFTYHVTGFMEGGFESLAPAVDGVISEQLNRLGSFLAAAVE